jgi:hypothetical protein
MLAIAAGAVMLVSANYALSGQVAWTPGGYAIALSRMLKKLVDKSEIQFSESFEVDGREMFKHACQTGLDGVVSKVRDSKYSSGRSNDWVKINLGNAHAA